MQTRNKKLKTRVLLSSGSFLFNSFVLYQSVKIIFCKKFPSHNLVLKSLYALFVYMSIEPANFVLNIYLTNQLNKFF